MNNNIQGHQGPSLSAPVWGDPECWARLPLAQKKCRHMVSGLVSYKLCLAGFDCARCPYDLMLAETELQGYGRHGAVKVH